MKSNLDIVDIFEIITEYKESQSKLIFFVNFTGILFTYLSLEPIENFDINWKSEINNNGKMTEGNAKSILYRNRNFTKKYRDEVKATSLSDKPEFICNDIGNQILRYVDQEALCKELVSRISEDDSIQKLDKEQILAESEPNMFLTKVLIYGVINGWKVKKDSAKTKQSKTEKESCERFEKVDYSVSVNIKSDTENQISSHKDTQQEQENRSPVLIFLPLSELKTFDEKKRKFTGLPTFTSANPADYVVFNAITDNPKHGDERNFVLVRDKTAGGSFVNELQIKPGNTYEVYNFFHNNAKSRLNTEANGSVGIAKDVKMYSQFPSTVKSGEKGKISTIISSSNANPKEVWDEAYISSTTAVAMRYVPASAKFYSATGKASGQGMSESLFKPGGTYLGWDELNGVLPGCAEYSGYVTYDLVADYPNFEMSKKQM